MDFLNDIKTSYSSFKFKRSKLANGQISRNDSILENLYQNLMELEEDLLISPVEDELSKINMASLHHSNSNEKKKG
jgi:hypothetical protein